MPFFYLNSKFINPDYKNRKKDVIIFTSEIQIKKLEKANQIFIDSTFKCCSNYYYKLLNIGISIDNGNLFSKYYMH